MKCGFCGREFDEAAGEKECRSCAMFGGCKKIKCPYCGFESPKEPASIKWLKRKIGRHGHDQSQD